MKIIRTTLLMLTLLLMLAGSWVGTLDQPATQQVDAGLKRALLSFATARALNGAISVVQGTEVDFTPLGMGVTLAPGQVLVPLNDLVGNFADLMLAASVAFGIQKFLIAMSSYWPISLLLTLAAVAWAFSHLRHGRSAPGLSKLLLVLLMLRFAIPVVVLGADALSQKFLAADYAASQQAVDRITGQVASLERPAANKAEAPGMFERIKEWVPKGADLTLYFDNLKKSAEQSIEHMVKLMVIFLLETLLIPLLLLWGLHVLLRGAFDLRALPARRDRLAR
jgi:hypothetical protein